MFQIFTGGIYPPETKHITEGKAFSNLSIPSVCYIPMQQHEGAPAIPCVSVGDTVSEGQLVARANGHLSANIHASVPGKVIDIGHYPTIHSKKGLCILIEAQGSFTASGSIHVPDSWGSISREELLKRIFDSGVVGLGGKACPTHTKLTVPENKKTNALIINCSESEPYITVNDMLMQTFPESIIEGIKIVQKILGVRQAIIGIEKNKKKSIIALQAAINALSLSESIKIKYLKPGYPQGEERQLAYCITGKKPQFGTLSPDSGTVILNAGTIFAIYEAVVIKKTFFERYITVTGEPVMRPGNYKVRLGTRVSDIIEECGGFTEEPGRIIMGGPMCGTAIDTMEIPVVKSTSGIVVLKKNRLNPEKYGPCIRCGRCAAACPAKLIPCSLVMTLSKGKYDRRSFYCIQCGLCAYACPSRRPVNHMLKFYHDKLATAQKAGVCAAPALRGRHIPPLSE